MCWLSISHVLTWYLKSLTLLAMGWGPNMTFCSQTETSMGTSSASHRWKIVKNPTLTQLNSTQLKANQCNLG